MTDFKISNNLVVLGSSTFTGRVDPLVLGSIPATSGDLRLSNASAVNVRNASNTLDLNVWSHDQSNEFDFGDASMSFIVMQAPQFQAQGVIRVLFASTFALQIADASANTTFLVDTTNGVVSIGTSLAEPTPTAVDRLFLESGDNLSVNSTLGSSPAILIQGQARTSGGVLHDSNWRVFVTPLSTTGFDGQSALRFTGAIDAGGQTEVLQMHDGGRVAFPQPEQFSIGSPTFIDNVQVNITGSFIDDYGGGPTETHKVKIQGGQTGDTGRTTRQTSVDVDTFIITQNLSQTINEVGAVFIDAPALTIGTDTVNIGYTLKVNNYPTDGTENYGLLVDGASATANLTALVRIGKQGLQTGIKLLVGGSVGFDNLDANTQMRLTGIYTSDGAATSASLLHVHTTLLPEDGTTDHITGAFFQGSLRTQVAVENVANISQVRIDEPNIQDNLTGDITNAQSLLITGAPTEGESNWALRILGGDVQLPSAGALQWSTDLKLFRDGPWELALRDGNNDNFFYIYNQFTDASNYERLALYAGGQAEFFIEAQTAGTGQDDTTIDIIANGNGQVILSPSSGVSYNFLATVFNVTPNNTLDLTNWRTIRAGTSLEVGAFNATPGVALFIDGTSLVAPGTRDSHDFLIRGESHDGSAHDIDWKTHVDVTANDGTGSLWTLRTRIDAAGYANALTILDDGTMTLNSAAALQWSTDLKLFRDGPWELALRDGLNDNFFYIYGTFTDAANYERLALYAGSSINYVLEPQSAGTGNNTINMIVRQLGGGTLTLGQADNFGTNIYRGGSHGFFSGQQEARTNLSMNTRLLSGLTGASVTTTTLIPAGVIVLGITTRVETTITGPATFSVGDGVDVDRWGAGLPVAAGSRSDITDYTSTTIQYNLAGTADVTITSDGVDFTAGAIRVTVHYMNVVGPQTS